jgi:hypothetical protein
MKKPQIDPKKVEEYLLQHPELLIMMGLLSLEILAKKEGKRPAHLKDMPPINTRTAGPWRGKGSFGHGFGPNKVSHK